MTCGSSIPRLKLAAARAGPRTRFLRTDPPARAVAVAAERHDELALFRRVAGQRPGHAYPEAPRLSRGPGSVVVPRSGPVLKHQRDPPGQPEPGARMATGTRRGPRSTRADISISLLEQRRSAAAKCSNCAGQQRSEPTSKDFSPESTTVTDLVRLVRIERISSARVPTRTRASSW